jgi:enoyl-CoA hydratase
MSHIEYGVKGAVGVIELNRPEKGNAQTPQFVRDLHAARLAAAADDDVRVNVVRAN